MEHEFYKAGKAHLSGEAEDVSKYYCTSRLGKDQLGGIQVLRHQGGGWVGSKNGNS